MAARHRDRPAAGFHLFLLLIFIGRCAVDAQPPSNESSNKNGPNISPSFNPSMAIVIAVLVSAFFFLGFFSIYIRNCGGDRNINIADAAMAAAAAAAGRARFQQGLNPEVLETFPALVYSEVKEHKIGKGALECAICLNEFDGDETIRLLPECDHVFHLECIDAWLATHVTCPVCRTNYTLYSPNRTPTVVGAVVEPAPAETVSPPDAPAAHHVAIAVDDADERKEEMRELARIASLVRRPRRSKRLSRSHSTGHSMMPQGEESVDRYTLRLPESLRKEIMAAGKLQRARTFAVTVAVSGAGDASMRKVSRGAGEGSSRRGRTIQLGRSDRWPSFFGRSLSAKILTMGNRRRGEERYVKEKSMNRKLSGVKATVDGRGGAAAAGGSTGNADDKSDKASAAPPSWV